MFLVASSGFGPGKQSWGYSEVRPKAFIFWWLYQAHSQPDTSDHYSGKPLLMWLQGGPGASSSGFGNFEEIGPLDRMLKPRENSWVKNYNVLFVDSPVGSGFSYVEDHSLLARNSTTVVSDLLEFLKHFYHTISVATTADWEGKVPLYIASESYGGRTAVEFAYALAQEIQTGAMHCKLAGLFLGSAWLSPMDSIAAWPTFLLGLGYLDDAGRERIEQRVAALSEKLAEERSDMTMGHGWHELQQAIIQETKGINCYNVLKPTRKDILPLEVESDEVLEYGETLWWYSDTGPPQLAEPQSSLERLMRGPVAHTLGIADKPPWGSQRMAVFDALSDDFLQPSVGTVERLLNETSVELVLFSGHLDLITCLSGTLAWVNRLFQKRSKFVPHRREAFTVVGGLNGDAIEGYRTTYSERFTHYTVLRAGHIVPADNPSAMAHILQEHIDRY
ncbi:retinoid-inducible serine carboxypeptidase-like [Anopheles maculipalpis]|uniref:retinoid-inducible serine carboxypeptidase-like n=1 Tax=Anopheles maculipalpis TaxID=1496333 RepID=UPI002159854E|nr:retinoid-inducible serine carboxypeptidase-like [Anopheles maculipalpis]